MTNIQMVDLKSQYLRIKDEIDHAILQCLDDSRFIGGEPVNRFERDLGTYLSVDHIISCGNCTDALQIAVMALDMKKGDEVIMPAFTYAAAAEAISLLGLIPIIVDVNEDDFNINIDGLEKAITQQTKAVVPVHLFGQCSDMDAICDIADHYDIKVLEDNAQSIGSEYIDSGKTMKSGTIGDIGAISFFPTKNLGCFGDGGCLCTNDENLASKARMITRHGQSKKFHHEIIGMNSRLDSIQAAILSIKLKYLEDFIQRRLGAAEYYDENLNQIEGLEIPHRAKHSSHVFHQYTIKVKNGKRNALKDYLEKEAVPSAIYYPLPLYKQKAFKKYFEGKALPVTEKLCEEVLSLPMHTELSQDQLTFICEIIRKFFA